MNYITHLTAFFERASTDTRLSATHISMYMSLFQFWNFNRFKNPISISRSEVMKISKISAIATYHKCIKELNAFGYIIYEPSYNPFKGSLVKMLDFEKGIIPKSFDQNGLQTGPEQVENNSISKNRQVLDSSQSGTVQAVVPYTNNTKHSKPDKQYCVTTPKTILKFEQVISTELKKRKVAPKEKSFSNVSNSSTFTQTPVIPKEVESLNPKITKTPVIPDEIVIPSAARNLNPTTTNSTVIPNTVRNLATPPFKIPHIAEVKLYFAEKDAQPNEADKFFNHYESNGWLVGGKSKMKNWQAAARNWLLNVKKFNQASVIPSLSRNLNKNNHLTASTNKSYQEPL